MNLRPLLAVIFADFALNITQSSRADEPDSNAEFFTKAYEENTKLQALGTASVIGE
jgi:hypothetical protein